MYCVILNTGITAAFKPTGQHYTNPTSNPVAASPVNFHPESRSSDSSVIVQPLSKPVSVSETTQLRDTLDIAYQYKQYQLKFWIVMGNHPIEV